MCGGQGKYVGLIQWGDYVPPEQRVCLCKEHLAERNEQRLAAGEKPFCPIAYTPSPEEIERDSRPFREARTEREFRAQAGLDPDEQWTAPEFHGRFSLGRSTLEAK